MFRCPPHHEAFPGGVVDSHLVVFPRTAVRIERDTAPPVVADPTVAVLYNPTSPYRRYEVDRRGDFCDYFAIDHGVLDDLSAAANADADRWFRSGHGPVADRLYLAQRRLFEAAAAGAPLDPLAVEEAVLAVVEALLASAGTGAAGEAPPVRPSTRAHHRRLALDTAEYLAANFAEPLRLRTVARAVGSAPHHLSRIFRSMTGSSIHQRVVALRLRRGLELLREGETQIARVAVELGFCGHSHFATAFREGFGVSPSAFRAEARDIRKILQDVAS
jgi:AraC family transcriptional regulator